MKRCIAYSALAVALVIFLTTCGAVESDVYSQSPNPILEENHSLARQAVLADYAETDYAPASSQDQDSGGDNTGASASRLRIYNGSAGLIVEDGEMIRRDLEKMTISAGGYVESSYAEYLVLRVPVERFDSIFAAVLEMGEVEYSRVETWDVTDAFADIRRTLATAMQTRERLYVLLEETTDPTEKAKILREIGRLTEEIEFLRQQLVTIESRVAFSRITLQLIPRLQTMKGQREIPFEWIASIDPLSPVGRELRARVELDLGDGFAVFSKERVFIAEDHRRVQVMISTVENSPRGDGAFWERALEYHLSPFYAQARPAGAVIGRHTLRGMEFISKDRSPYKFYLGVIVDGPHLHIVQIFSPEAEAVFTELYAALGKGTLR